MIILILLILLLILIKTNETFIEDDFKPDFISIYNKKLERYLTTNIAKNILLIGSISQKKLDFFMNYFNDAIIYVYNEDHVEYKNINENIIQNDDYPYKIDEITKLKDNNKYFDIIITQGQVSIDNFIFVAKNYIDLLEKDGIIIFENIQTIDSIGKIIDSIPLNIKNKIEVYDLRRVNGKYDNICITLDKNNL